MSPFMMNVYGLVPLLLPDGAVQALVPSSVGPESLCRKRSNWVPFEG